MNRQEREQLIAQYAAGYDQVAAALQGFPKDKLTAHPIPGKWSAAEIVHHLADSEGTSAIRIRKLLTEENAVIQGYDEAAWAKLLRYNEREIAPSLEAFRLARATTMQILPSLSDADWARSGTHSESGSYSAETWLKIYAVHAHNHAAQIARLKEALSSGVAR
jgi:DinB family protein